MSACRTFDPDTESECSSEDDELDQVEKNQEQERNEDEEEDEAEQVAKTAKTKRAPRQERAFEEVDRWDRADSSDEDIMALLCSAHTFTRGLRRHGMQLWQRSLPTPIAWNRCYKTLGWLSAMSAMVHATVLLMPTQATMRNVLEANADVSKTELVQAMLPLVAAFRAYYIDGQYDDKTLEQALE